MKIVIKTKNIKLNQPLRDYIQEKFGSLEKFVKIFQNDLNEFFGRGKPKTEMWVEIGKETAHHQKGLIFRAEAQLRLPGKSVRKVSLAEDLRQAIDEVKDGLQQEFKQYKQKFSAQSKRRARVLKKSLKFAPSAQFKKRKGARIREEGT